MNIETLICWIIVAWSFHIVRCWDARERCSEEQLWFIVLLSCVQCNWIFDSFEVKQWQLCLPPPPLFRSGEGRKQSGKIRSKFKHDLATIRLTITCVWTRRFDSRHHRLWGWMEDRKHVSALKNKQKKTVQIYFLRSKFFCKTKPVISLLIRSCTILQNIVWEALR